jgi:hypothetical protein
MRDVRRFVSKWNLITRGMLVVIGLIRGDYVSIPTDFNRYHIYWTSEMSLINMLVIMMLLSILMVIISDVYTIVKNNNYLDEKY